MAPTKTTIRAPPDDCNEPDNNPRIASQGHWMLSQMGKRVLRPGGVELSREMLAALNITPADDVVEFAPGLGKTAELTLRKQPATYTAIERDKAAAETVRCYLKGANQTCRILVPGGRFGIHELGLVPDDVSDELQQEMKKTSRQSCWSAAKKEIIMPKNKFSNKFAISLIIFFCLIQLTVLRALAGSGEPVELETEKI